MIKDLIVSFKDNFKDKIKNPFLGSYLLVWLIRNWDLIFSLFNFNKGTTLENKISIITVYLKDNPFFGGLVVNIGFTFLFLIITYILLNISRGIVNLFEKQLKPWIYKLTDKSSIVLKEEFQRMKDERDNLLMKLNLERESKSKLEIENQKIIENLKRDNTYDSKSIQEEIDGDMDVHRESFLLKVLKKKNLNATFKEICKEIKKGGSFPWDDERIDSIIEYNLIEFKSEDTSYHTRTYAITELGESILSEIIYKE